jgi:hypothetical protein
MHRTVTGQEGYLRVTVSSVSQGQPDLQYYQWSLSLPISKEKVRIIDCYRASWEAHSLKLVLFLKTLIFIGGIICINNSTNRSPAFYIVQGVGAGAG